MPSSHKREPEFTDLSHHNVIENRDAVSEGGGEGRGNSRCNVNGETVAVIISRWNFIRLDFNTWRTLNLICSIQVAN